MTQQEFETRTGMTVTVSEYERIERLYMAAGNMDKDTFCKEFKKTASSQLVQELAMSLRITEGKLNTAKMEKKAAEARENDMANFIMEQAEKWGASDLRDKAIELLGAREYLRRKLARGFNLWEADKELLQEILKETA